ncbi:MAG: hypothetical protein KAI71_02205 [Candidatus Pacebacteria bacterium]|nr:hypothetical protein [Candidatus Paceibacterota bacterium]
MKKYNQKLVISGKTVEIYKYTKWQLYDFKGKRKNFDKDKTNKRSALADHRSTTMICNLVNCNEQLNKFFTLTFAENVKDLTKANYTFNIFVKKLKLKYPYFQYVCVVEFQQRGAVHYHLVCNLEFVRKKKLEKIWGNGWVEINRARNVLDLGRYFVKNFIHYNLGQVFATHADKRKLSKKDLAKIVNSKKEKIQLRGRKKFFCSRGLARPIEIKGTLNVIEFCSKNSMQKTFEKSWKHKDLIVDYRSYNLDKNKS